ncbi:MAG: threonine-phosphate decarboxylase [Magnetococcales bacterium]|nr:threonine-phosphate decarboxylase [Magnetococcales bacterium]
MLNHGGGIRQAAINSGLPPDSWLDVSTGINPHGWRVPAVPGSSWLRLPEEGDGLEASAKIYYKSDHLLPVAGSQAAIQALSRLTENFRVAVLSPTYAEHAHAWGMRDNHQARLLFAPTPKHRVDQLSLSKLEDTLELYNVVVVVNPNNPTGRVLSKEKLRRWHLRMMTSGRALGEPRWLIVDEAFMDSTPEGSVISDVGEPGLIVLRSLGKFFGLAGARVGFIFAWPELLQSIQELLGPWPIAGPSRWVARLALDDVGWQKSTRSQLLQQRDRLRALLSQYGLDPTGGTTLFQWVERSRSQEMADLFQDRGVLIRHFKTLGGIRFGLPGEESEWVRLEASLSKIQSLVQLESPAQKRV